MPNKPPVAKTGKASRHKSARERGYTHGWEIARRLYLANEPLCVHCKTDGRYTIARVVDHIQPHRGNQQLFWDRNNWQALCKSCHAKKSGGEK